MMIDMTKVLSKLLGFPMGFPWVPRIIHGLSSKVHANCKAEPWMGRWATCRGFTNSEPGRRGKNTMATDENMSKIKALLSGQGSLAGTNCSASHFVYPAVYVYLIRAHVCQRN